MDKPNGRLGLRFAVAKAGDTRNAGVEYPERRCRKRRAGDARWRVDADSQCNLTGLILGDDFEKYYTEDESKRQNIKDGVSS